MSQQDKGQYAYQGLDRVFHEKARLGIMTSLFTHTAGYTFNELKELCDLTDGNLSRHIQLLKEEGYVEVIKSFYKNKPLTLCKMTALGRDKFKEYMSELERVLKDALKGESKLSIDGKQNTGFSPA